MALDPSRSFSHGQKSWRTWEKQTLSIDVLPKFKKKMLMAKPPLPLFNVELHFVDTDMITTIKTDSAQSSSNKCKNYLLKIYARHINFLNTIWNFSLYFISPGDSAVKIPSILEKFNFKPRKSASCLCFQLTQNVRFKWNMCNFKFNFLSWGHLESLNLDRILLPLFKILPCYEGFLVT